MNGKHALTAEKLVVKYGAGRPAVCGIDLAVDAGEVVALLGANGAGKTSTISALAGTVPCAGGRTTLHGRETTAALHRRARHGLGLVTEDRCVFTQLTTRQNLILGRGDPERALELFPELEDHLDRRVGLLSGGQQQMLAVGRVLASSPKVILADELSLGLAPTIVTRLLTALRSAAAEGVAVLLVEQHVNLALDIADRAYVMRRGVVEFDGSARKLKESPELVAEMYLEGSE